MTEADTLSNAGSFSIENNKMTIKMDFISQSVAGMYYFSFSDNDNTLILTEVGSGQSIYYIKR